MSRFLITSGAVQKDYLYYNGGGKSVLYNGLNYGGVGNILINGDFESSAGWTLDGTASMSSGKLIISGDGGAHRSDVSTTTSGYYDLYVTISNYVSGTIKIFSPGFVGYTWASDLSGNGTIHIPVFLTGGSLYSFYIITDDGGYMDIDSMVVEIPKYFRGVYGVSTFTYSGTGTEEVYQVSEVAGFSYEIVNSADVPYFREVSVLNGTCIEIVNMADFSGQHGNLHGSSIEIEPKADVQINRRR